MNNFNFSGNVGRDAETKHLPSGTAVMNFPVAVNVGFGEKKSTLWVDCAVFGKRAESGLLDLLKKGAVVVCNGEANLNTYQTKDGEFRAKVTCNVNDVDIAKFVEDDSAPSHTPAPAPNRAPVAAVDIDDSIPF